MCDYFTLSTTSVKRLQYASKCMYSLRTCKVCQLPAVAAVKSDTTDRRPPGVLSQAGFHAASPVGCLKKATFLKSIGAQG